MKAKNSKRILRTDSLLQGNTSPEDSRLTFAQDHTGHSETHGYTKDEDGSVYYWTVNGDGFSWRHQSADVGYYLDIKTREWVSKNVYSKCISE